jgi:hypothetical protein
MLGILLRFCHSIVSSVHFFGNSSVGMVLGYDEEKNAQLLSVTLQVISLVIRYMDYFTTLLNVVSTLVSEALLIV